MRLVTVLTGFFRRRALFDGACLARSPCCWSMIKCPLRWWLACGANKDHKKRPWGEAEYRRNTGVIQAIEIKRLFRDPSKSIQNQLGNYAGVLP